MRSIGMLAVVTGTLVWVSGCSDGAGTPPPDNIAPAAGFTEVCTHLTCVFTDASTDSDGNTDITTRTWTFGDGTPVGAGTSVTHVYAGPNTYTVGLKVTDNGGLSNEVSKPVIVTALPPENQAPVAGFTFVATDNSVAFTNTSTDADGTITYLWNFGEPTSGDNESALKDPSHSYAVTAPATFTVTLTVTDDDGATDVETQTVTVSPPLPGVQGCITLGKTVECTLDIPVQSTLKLKLTGISCDLEGNRVTIPPPIGDQVFLRVCWRTVGEELGIFGGPMDELIVYEAGTQARIWITQGTANRDFPVLGSPAGVLVGTFPNWTINFEDGDNPGGEGEPDSTDVVLAVQATEVR